MTANIVFLALDPGARDHPGPAFFSRIVLWLQALSAVTNRADPKARAIGGCYGGEARNCQENRVENGWNAGFWGWDKPGRGRYSPAMNDATSPIVWRGMTRPQLDAAYDNTSASPNAAELRDGWIVRSEKMRRDRPELLDLRYGPRERNRVDVFRCGKANAPLFVFIHGGYWQRNSKEMFACMGEGPLAAGCDVALIGYTLAPEVTLTDIVAETHAAIRWLRAEGPRRGFGAGRLIVSGWSAGGHLTAAAMGLDEVDGGLAISGIYDVEPCRLNNLNDKLKLTAAEAAAMSPILHLPQRKTPVTVAFGAGELPELQRQSRAYHEARTAAGLPSRLLPLEPHNHFSVMGELIAADGRLTAALKDLIVALR
jgi:acetyl esterase/lipase